MSDRPVCCIRCGMWEFLETTCLPEVHICARCMELQLLRDRVRELELRLDDLSLVRENEKIIDRSYKQVVTPGPQKEDKWVTVRKGKSQKGDVPESTPVAVSHNSNDWATDGRGEGSEQSVEGSPVVALQNRYIVLDSVEGDDPPGVSHEDQIACTETGSEAQKGKKGIRREIVVGDAMVRGMDRRFCGRERDSRIVVCLPGAGVLDVSERVGSILKREGNQTDVIVHIGENDVGRKSRGVIREQFREMGARLKSKASRVAISGLLPVPSASEARNREILQLNTWLKDWCKREGFKFIDHWEVFKRGWHLYGKDGLHLNWKGTNILAGSFARVFRQGLN